MIAQRGTLVMADGGLRVVMENGNRQTRDRDDGRLNLLYFDRYAVDLSSNPNQKKRTSRDRNEMFVGELFDAVPGAAEDDRHVLENRAEGHRRLVSPLLGLTLVMIALAAMFQGDFFPPRPRPADSGGGSRRRCGARGVPRGPVCRRPPCGF